MSLRKATLTATLLAGLVIAEESASKLSISGSLDADVIGSFDPDAKAITWQSNHELDITLSGKLSEKAGVDVFITSYTVGAVPGGMTPIYDSTGTYYRWPNVVFDGITAYYESAFGLKTSLGDLVASGGAFMFYGYKRPLFFGSVMKENYLRGVGFDFKGATLYMGSSDSDDMTASTYAAYSAEVGPATIKPFVFATTNLDDANNVKAGLDVVVALGEHSINATYGFIKDASMDPSHTAKLEATLAFGKVSVAGTAFMAFTADDTLEASVVNVPEESFFYVEPGYSINDMFTVGVPLEIHNRIKGSKDSDFSFYPTLYVNPAENMQWVIWAGPSIYYDAESTTTVAAGAEIIASF